jgi:hypothetical protein
MAKQLRLYLREQAFFRIDFEFKRGYVSVITFKVCPQDSHGLFIIEKGPDTDYIYAGRQNGGFLSGSDQG